MNNNAEHAVTIQCIDVHTSLPPKQTQFRQHSHYWWSLVMIHAFGKKVFCWCILPFKSFFKFSLWAVVQWQFKLKSFITDYVFKQTKHMGAPLNSVKRSCFPSWLEKTNLIVSFIFFLLIFVNVHISVHTLSDLMQDTH